MRSKRNHLPANLFNTFAGNVLMESCSPIYSVISPRVADLEPGVGWAGVPSPPAPTYEEPPGADTQDTSGTRGHSETGGWFRVGKWRQTSVNTNEQNFTNLENLAEQL